MKAPLTSVGPSNFADDEHTITRGYQRWLTPFLIAIPLAVASFLDTKWVVAVSASVVIGMAHEAGGRLHDLCIRNRRTNLLLAKT
jgi:hypothetical protein